ncbi:MAG: hypothetical protein IPL63_11015 [Saprospiraceae bacterium]|nr:hypothetical protein [Saprospiraceae bacterium]
MWKYKEIDQYQLTQTGEKNYTLKISTTSDFLRNDEILNEYKSYLGNDANIKIQIVNEIPLLASGKRRKVVHILFMSEKLNILITGVGGPTPRSFARAIKEIGDYKKYKLIATDIHPHAVGLYQTFLFDKSYITPKSSETGYWRVMEDIIQKENIDMAIILPEQEVLAWSERQKKGSLPCKALIPPKEAVDKMLDKSILTEALKSSGLVPVSVIIDGSDPNLQKNGIKAGISLLDKVCNGFFRF